MKNKLTPGKKAQRTAKWARTMTKWYITYRHLNGAKWQVVDFCGPQKAEARGIVDLMAIRKDHRQSKNGLNRGDLFEIILIQTKGGSAPRPTMEDILRLSKVAKYYRAKAAVLAEWQKGKILDFFKLKGDEWHPIEPETIFG